MTSNANADRISSITLIHAEPDPAHGAGGGRPPWIGDRGCERAPLLPAVGQSPPSATEAATGARLIQRVGRGIRLAREGEQLAGRAITGMTLGAPRVSMSDPEPPRSRRHAYALRRPAEVAETVAYLLSGSVAREGAFGPPGRGGHCCTGASLITLRTASSDAPSAGNPTNPQVAPAAA